MKNHTNHAQRTHDLNQNGRRQREKNPPAQPRENFFPPQTRVCLFSATRARSIRVAIWIIIIIRTSDLEIPHRLLVVRVFVLLPEFTETRKTDVRCAHERAGRPWHGFIATWFDAVLLRLRVRDVREHVVELVRER